MNLFSKYLRWVLLLLGIWGGSPSTRAQEKPLSDAATVSLITVAPGTEVYAQYGHTALRIADPKRGFDLCFNYGLFDFNAPHFIYRFVRGETDYEVGATAFSDFLLEYQLADRGVTEQVLNLKPDEKERIWQALVKNVQPENKTYRYNFFFNNCSTKPRDIVASGLDGRIDYRWKGAYPTLRRVLHHYTAPTPWIQFGIDFLIGAQADAPASLSDQQFAPEILSESFARAVVVQADSAPRPLVSETRHPVVPEPESAPSRPSLWNPIVVCWTLCVLGLVVIAYEHRRNKHCMGLTAVLHGVFGLTGSLIAFLALFSQHPTTHLNFLLLWQHPFHLIFAFGMIFGWFRKHVGKPYLAVSLTLEIVALAGLLFLPQTLHPAMIPLLLLLLTRTAWTTYRYRMPLSNE
jgi:hypothetical protein